MKIGVCNAYKANLKLMLSGWCLGLKVNAKITFYENLEVDL